MFFPGPGEAAVEAFAAASPAVDPAVRAAATLVVVVAAWRWLSQPGPAR